jgi:hypothetical protein
MNLLLVGGGHQSLPFSCPTSPFYFVPVKMLQSVFLSLLRRFNPAEPVVEKSVIL